MDFDLPTIPARIQKWLDTPDGHCEIYWEDGEMFDEPFTYDSTGKSVLRWDVDGERTVIKLRLYKNTREYVESLNAKILNGSLTVTIERDTVAGYLEGPKAQ